MKNRIFIFFLVSIATRLMSQPVADDIGRLPSITEMRELSFDQRDSLLEKYYRFSNLSTDFIEGCVKSHAESIVMLSTTDKLSEIIKVIVLCEILFEHPKVPFSKLESQFPIKGVVFIKNKEYAINPDEPSEAIVPLINIKSHRPGYNFDVGFFFATYNGSPPRADTGVNYFNYCRKNLRLRECLWDSKVNRTSQSQHGEVQRAKK